MSTTADPPAEPAAEPTADQSPGEAEAPEAGAPEAETPEAEAGSGRARRAPARPVTAGVLRLANRSFQLLRELEMHDLAERITSESDRWKDNSLVAVVAGDIKRGKSSLLNSAIAQPGLLPVDADIATSVHLVIRHGDDERIEVTKIGEGGQVLTFPIERAQLIDYASMRGDAQLREGVTNVDVIVDHPLLERGLTLIDTPGVGGMSRGHRDITMAALQRADVLLFTISAQEPVSRTELEFLAEASERIDNVVFVVTKADLNTDDVNARLGDENRAKLAAFQAQLETDAKAGNERAAELAARFGRLLKAPYLLTSTLLADQGARRAAAGRMEQALDFRERSGLNRLEAMLDHSIARREDVRLANILQVVAIAAREARAEQVATIRAAAGDLAVSGEITAKQAALEELGSKQARWRGSLANGIQRMQATVNRFVARELNLVRSHYRDLLTAPNIDVEALEAVLPSELEKSLHAAWSNLAATANAELQKVIDELLGELGIDAIDTVVGDLVMPEGLTEIVGQARALQTDFSMLDDGVPMATQTFTFANIARSAGGMLGMATGGFGLLAYGVGAAVSIHLTKMRRTAREKARAVAEFNRVINEALFGQEGIAKEFQTELSLRIIDARETFEALIDQRLTERRKQLEQQARDLQQLARSEAATRQRRKEQAEKRLVDLNGIDDELNRLRAQVHRQLQA